MGRSMTTRSLLATPAILSALAVIGMGAQAQALHGPELVAALKRGGYVILMRHASSPREAPAKEAANADNVKVERQLDAEGRETATAMGKALRELGIPVGKVYSSPTYRALETVKYAQLPKAEAVVELGDNGQSMQGGTLAQAEWLRKKVLEFPKGSNTILVTHMPNIRDAFPAWADVADGESLILGPDGKGGATLVARVKIGEWSSLK